MIIVNGKQNNANNLSNISKLLIKDVNQRPNLKIV